MFKQLKSLWQWRELAMMLAIYAMKNEKRAHSFGDAWFLLNPLIQMAIFYTMVEIIFQRHIENFALFFFCGFFIYQLFTKMFSLGPTLFVQSGGMIKTASFPRIVIIAPIIIRSLYEFGIELVLLTGAMYLYGVWPDFRLIYFPLFVLVTILGMAGILMMLSIFGCRFRDLVNLMQHLNRLLFYGSPVMYSASFVPEKFLDLYFLNPVAVGIEITRYCLIGGEGVSQFQVIYYGAFCLLFFIMGFVIFNKYEWKVSKYV